MRALAAAGFGSAFLCLVAAAYLKDPAWRYALVGIMIGLSAGLCAAAGLVAGRLREPVRRALAAGLVTGAAAAFTRQVLLAVLRARAGGAPPQIRPASLFAAVFTIVGGLGALLWGVAALRRLAAEPEPGASRLRRGLELTAAGLCVALGLYGVSPAWQALGLKVDHWTFVGLAGLAVVAYLIEEAVAWAQGRRGPPPAAGDEAPVRARRRRRRG